MIRPLTPNNQTLARIQWNWQDLLLGLALLALLAFIMRTATQFSGEFNPSLTISTELNALPGYTAQSLLRLVLAYGLSLFFSLGYSYLAYQSRWAATFLMPLLDILQAVPVLSFLPGVVLALIALFPGQRAGVELAAVLLIFTGMVWNMTFSFYQSLCAIPRELQEAATVYRLNHWQRFWTLELPAGVIGLVWNSVMSVAGGWFFLMPIESFTMGNQDFRLPGLGSFLAEAANRGDMGAISWGLAVLISVIITLDLLIWRPLIAWAEKFKMQMQTPIQVSESFILDWIRRSPLLRIMGERLITPWQEGLTVRINRRFPQRSGRIPLQTSPLRQIVGRGLLLVSGGLVIWGLVELGVTLQQVTFGDWKAILLGSLLTMMRVMVALALSLLWAVPVGVMIGRDPRLAQILQPLAQIAASVPATALFPVVLLTLTQRGGGLSVGAILLMMLGTMWYVLFNVIAGAQAIPSELLEVSQVYKLGLINRWRTLILPAIFPYLMTGIITAVGGAWNASIVSEYVQFQGKTQSINGLGAIISQASSSNNFPVLLAATMVMSGVVVLNNRLIWRRLYHLATEKYQLI